jgi:hypothetical protein
MDGSVLLAALEAAGAEFELLDGDIRVTVASKALTPEMRQALQDKGPLRAAYLEREWLRYLATRPLRTDDPRPDIAGDSTLWSLLLNRIDGMGNTALREALHCLRCLGARLVRIDGALRLVRGDELSAEEHAAYREDWLVPHVRDLTEALTRLDAQARQIERRRRVAA